MNLKKIYDEINIPVILYFLGCIIAGIIGFLFLNHNIKEDMLNWIFYSLILEGLIYVGSFLFSIIITELFIRDFSYFDYTNDVNNSAIEVGKTLITILTTISIISINIFIIYKLL